MYRTDLYKNFDQENMLLDLNSRVTMEINPLHVVKLEPINDIGEQPEYILKLKERC